MMMALRRTRWSAARASVTMGSAGASRRLLPMLRGSVCAWLRGSRPTSLRGCPLSGGVRRAGAGCVLFARGVGHEHARRRRRSSPRGRAASAQGARDRRVRGLATAVGVAHTAHGGVARPRDRRAGSRSGVALLARGPRRVRAQGCAANGLLQRQRAVRCAVDPQPDRRGRDRGRSRR